MYTDCSIDKPVSNLGMNQKVISDFICYSLATLAGLCILSGFVGFSYVILFVSILSIANVQAIIPLFCYVLIMPSIIDPGLPLGIDKIYLGIVALGLLLRYLNNKESRRHLFWGWGIAWIVLAYIISGLHSEYDQPFGTLPVIVVNILTFIVFSISSFSEKEIRDLTRRFAISNLVFLSFLLISFFVRGISLDSRLSIGAVDAEDLNSNQFAMGILLISIFMFCYGYLSARATKILLISVSIVGLIIIVLSGSRASTIAFITTLFLCIIISKKKNVKTSQSYFYRFVVLLFVLLLLYWVFIMISSISDVFNDRFSLTTLYDSNGSNRFPSLQAEFLYIIPDHLWFGVGPSAWAEMDALWKYSGLRFSSHNFLGSMLTQFGLVGAIPHIVFFFLVIKGLLKRIKNCNLFLIPFGLVMSCIFNGIGEQIFNSRKLWFSLAFSVLMFNSIKSSDPNTTDSNSSVSSKSEGK